MWKCYFIRCKASLALGCNILDKHKVYLDKCKQQNKEEKNNCAEEGVLYQHAEEKKSRERRIVSVHLET